MEGLRSAEALQVHWDAAHSESRKEERDGVSTNGDGASATPPIKRFDILIVMYTLN